MSQPDRQSSLEKKLRAEATRTSNPPVDGRSLHDPFAREHDDHVYEMFVDFMRAGDPRGFLAASESFKSLRARTCQALAHSDLGDRDLALSILTQALQEHFTAGGAEAEAYVAIAAIGEVHEDLEHAELAWKWRSRAVRAAPSRWSGHYNRMCLASRLGNAAWVEQAFSALEEEIPDWAQSSPLVAHMMEDPDLHPLGELAPELWARIQSAYQEC